MPVIIGFVANIKSLAGWLMMKNQASEIQNNGGIDHTLRDYRVKRRQARSAYDAHLLRSY
ncbi:MAG: hypothetical protein WC829_11370 [Hyphomicrobium sp.]|jgi:hypothetical protein